MVNIFVVFLLIGYKKDPFQKNKLIIDDSVANIVQKIFFLYTNGSGTVEIAQFLNKNHYLSPSGYRKTGIIQQTLTNSYLWNEVTICNILKNEVYIGNTVQNKKSIISYKIKKIKSVEKEKHIRVENTHPSIIDFEVFRTAQAILEKRGTNSKLKYDYLLRGLLYCHHCKRKLQIILKNSSKNQKKSYPYIVCRNIKSHSSCPVHINYTLFEDYLFSLLKDFFSLFSKEKILSRFSDLYQKENLLKQNKNYNKNIELEKNIIKIENILDSLYIDKVSGIVSEENYLRLSQKLNHQKTEFLNQQKIIENNFKFPKNNSSEKINDSFKKSLDLFFQFPPKKQSFLFRLINKIEIDSQKNIYIFFNFSKINSISQNTTSFINFENLLKKNNF